MRATTGPTEPGKRLSGVGQPSLSHGSNAERACDLAVLGFAAFTLLCHLAVALGTGFASLRIGAAIVTLSLAGWAVTRAFRQPACAAARLADLPLWVLVAVGFAIPLFFHRVSLDDAWYLNLGVRSLMDPIRPLLRYDTLHGIDGLSVVMPVWRVEAFPLLAPCLASIAPWSVIEASHWGVAALSGAFLPLALSRVFGWLTPGHRLTSVAVALVILALMSAAPRGYGVYALGLQHQGKAVFLSAGVPLLIFYAARFGERGGLRRGLRLAAAQLACVGLTSTAVWAAPLVSLVAAGVGAGVGGSVSTLLRRLTGVAATSLVPLGLGLALRQQMAQTIAPISAGGAGHELVEMAISTVLGSPTLGIFAALVCATGWWVAPAGSARRLCVMFPLVFAALLYNPFVARGVAAQLTGEPTYFRVFWFLPLPLILTLTATAPLRLLTGPRGVRGIAVVGIVAVVALTTSWRSVFHADSGSRFEAWGLDVDPEPFEVAQSLVRHSAPGRFVLAPNKVSVWVGTLPDAAFAVIPRRHYFKLIRPVLDADEIVWRENLAAPYIRAIGAVPEDTGVAWDEGLDEHGVDAVCLIKARANSRLLRRRLERLGFEPVLETNRYEVWAKPPSVKRAGHPG